MRTDDEIVVRLVAPEEAPLLITLIRRCYGETYIDPSFYRETQVRELLESGRLQSIGAFTEGVRLVGHMGITLRAHGGITADAGMTLVDPAHRGHGIARRVAFALAERSIELGLVGVHDYPVTVHAATQRIGAGVGVDTGLMLANMPGDVVFREMLTPSSGRRTSSLIRWLPFGPAPERSVFLPERYQREIELLYAKAHLLRTILAPRTSSADRESGLTVAYDERRQTLRVAVTRIGEDLGSRIEAERRRAAESGGLVAHVDLPLGDSGTPAATQTLCSLDFFFAGLLPEYRDGDVLRLQWLAPSADCAGSPILTTDSTRAIESFVLNECLSKRAEGRTT
ncbi:MAG: GNAT family N-acetyltransferase [Polyangiales bacterium]